MENKFCQCLRKNTYHIIDNAVHADNEPAVLVSLAVVTLDVFMHLHSKATLQNLL